MKFIKRIFFFLSLFVLYIIAKEFLQLYVLIQSVHPVLARLFVVLSGFVFIYFAGIPLIKIFSMPKSYGPVYDENNENQLIQKRMERFKKNKFLKEKGIDVNSLGIDKAGYDTVISQMDKGVDELRRKHIPQLFYSTTIAQNGFLDAMLILSASINHIKEIFILYNGRVSNQDLLIILKKIYYAMAIGGSEAAEYATQEVLNRFATDSIKAIPFLSRISASLIDGYVNAVMLTRISYIAENYCKKTVIKSDRELSPSPEFVFSSAKNITKDIRERVFHAFTQKAKNAASRAVTPVTDLYHKSIELLSPQAIDPDNQYSLEMPVDKPNAPFVFGLKKVFQSLRKKNKSESIS